MLIHGKDLATKGIHRLDDSEQQWAPLASHLLSIFNSSVQVLGESVDGGTCAADGESCLQLVSAADDAAGRPNASLVLVVSLPPFGEVLNSTLEKLHAAFPEGGQACQP